LAARCVFMPSARLIEPLDPSWGDLLVGTGAFHEQIERSHDGGDDGHALGAKRVALGRLSRGRYGLGLGARHDGVSVSARGFATIYLRADCWR
jgi:hypothetical protein